jgi:hypothetical protein
MLARKQACVDAYRHTPHGKPVKLISTAEASTHKYKTSMELALLALVCITAHAEVTMSLGAGST